MKLTSMAAVGVAAAAALAFTGTASANTATAVDCERNQVRVDLLNFRTGERLNVPYEVQVNGGQPITGAHRFTGPSASFMLPAAITGTSGTVAVRVTHNGRAYTASTTYVCAPPEPAFGQGPPVAQNLTPTVRIRLPREAKPRPRPRLGKEPRCVERPGGFAIIVVRQGEGGPVKRWECRYPKPRPEPPVAG